MFADSSVKKNKESNINEDYRDRETRKSTDEWPQTSVLQFILNLFNLILKIFNSQYNSFYISNVDYYN